MRQYRDGEKFVRKTGARAGRARARAASRCAPPPPPLPPPPPEYEKFRSRTNLVFLVFVLARLACWWTLPYNAYVDVLETAWFGWLLYYYTTLAV